jgi:galactosyl transferase GMA12/MNN10 family
MADRRVLCSIGFGPQERLLTLSRPTFERYARRHGYDLDVRTEPLQRERPGQWNKILLLRELVDRYDLVVWVDADAVIVDTGKDIADELEDGRFLYLVEHCYDGLRVPNTGVLMLRSGPEAAALLDELWNDTDFAEHRWHEQAALMLRLGYVESLPTRPSELRTRKTKFLGIEWNSTPQHGARDAFIKHTPGHRPLTRMAFMAKDLVVAGLRRRLRRR